MTGPPLSNSDIGAPSRILSPDEYDHAQMLSPEQLKQAKFPVLPAPPKPAARDAAYTAAGITPPGEENRPKLTGMARILTQYVAAPLWDHPIMSVAALIPPVGAYYAGMMGKDIVEYAAQKAGEMSLNPTERALAEGDPQRIPGERAAVEAVMLGAAPLVHGAIKGVEATRSQIATEVPAAAPRPAEPAGPTGTPTGHSPEAIAHLNSPAGQNELAARLLDSPEKVAQFRQMWMKSHPNGEPAPVPVDPAAKSVIKQHVDDIVDSWKSIFAPATRSTQAAQAASILRATTGEMARTYEQASFKLDEFRRAVEPLPEADKLGFIDAIEGGKSQASPEFQDAANTIRTTLDGMRDQIRGLGTGKLDNFIENYFPHIWSDPEKATDAFAEANARVNAKRPMEGGKAFLKERTIPTTAEGMALGLEPVTTNPVDLTLLKLREMQRYYMAHSSLKEMQDAGLVKYVGSGGEIPQGYTRINDRITTVFGPRQGAVKLPEGANITPQEVTVPGTRIMGEYWAPEPVAKVVNNYLSPGLRGNAIYDAYRGLGNSLNQAQLGLSAFHLMFTSMDASVSRAALGLEYITGGQLSHGFREMLSAPVAPVTNMRLGARIRSAYLDPANASPDMQALAHAVAEAGGRIKMDSFYKNSAPERMVEAWKQGEYGKAVGLSLPALFEYAAKPIMEHIVPLQKLGVFGDLARKTLDELPPGTSLADRRQALGDAWNSVDNRMGQLVYDNLFWSKTFKDLSMASVRSVGWNIGTIRELGGGIADVTGSAADIARGRATEMTHKAAYVIALPMTVAFYGAIYQYLRTGQGPQEFKDYFFPQTGEKDADGNPERVQIASYMKDFFAYAGHPWETVKHKMSPILSTVYEMLQNEDFYGDMIRNPNDPFVQQVGQEAKYVAQQVEPFSFRNMSEQSKRGDQSTVTKLGSWFGITPAPRSEVRTEAQNRMMEYLAERKMSGATPEDAEARQTRSEILRGMRGNSGVKLGQAVTDAIERHQLTAPDVVKLLKRAGLTPAQEQFKRLTLVQAVDVFKKANRHEKEIFAEALLNKVMRAGQTATQ